MGSVLPCHTFNRDEEKQDEACCMIQTPERKLRRVWTIQTQKASVLVGLCLLITS